MGSEMCIRDRGGLYLEGRFNGGFFVLPVWGAYIWRGLYMEGLIFRNFTVFFKQHSPEQEQVVNTYQTLFWSGWPKGFGAVNPSPHC